MSSESSGTVLGQLFLDPIFHPSANGDPLRPDAPRRPCCRSGVFCLPSFLWTTVSLKASDRAAATHPSQGPFVKGELLPSALASC